MRSGPLSMTPTAEDSISTVCATQSTQSPTMVYKLCTNDGTLTEFVCMGYTLQRQKLGNRKRFPCLQIREEVCVCIIVEICFNQIYRREGDVTNNRRLETSRNIYL